MSLFKKIDRFFKLATKTDLFDKLHALRPQLAVAAQKVYDDWDASDEVDGDWQVGSGGICHLIADAMLDVMARALPDLNMTTVSSSHEVHVYTIVGITKQPENEDDDKEEEYYIVDIRPYLYETGGGYSWQKIPDIEFTPDFITIESCDPLELDENGDVKEIY